MSRGSKDNTRWCGPHPAPVGVVTDPAHPRHGLPYYENFRSDFSGYTRRWNPDSYIPCTHTVFDNGPLTANDSVWMWTTDMVDRRTGFKRGWHNRTHVEDLDFSRRELCAIDWSNIDENRGMAICRRNRRDLPQPEVLNAIDWNMNGVFDAGAVDLTANPQTDPGTTLRTNAFFFHYPHRAVLSECDSGLDEWRRLRQPR